ncbi:MAG: hypothetical protein QM667_11340, partial [Asticcacaulis sp.]
MRNLVPVMILSGLVCGGSAAARAESVVVTPDAPYAVPVETFKTGKGEGKPGLLWTGFSAGGYSFFSKLTSQGRETKVFSSQKKIKVTVDYRFVKADQTPVLTGKCQIGGEAYKP